MKTTVNEYKDTSKENRIRVIAEENGQILLPLEGYKNKKDMRKTAIRVGQALLRKYAPKLLCECPTESI